MSDMNSNSSNEKGFYFLLSIGPVQGFIASARKAQDLWSGSFLMSQLVRTAIVSATGRGRVIFPIDLHASGSEVASLPNHVLMHLDGEWSKEKIQNFGDKVKKAVETEFGVLVKHGMEQLNHSVDDISLRQIEGAIELFWVATLVSGDHKADFAAVETALAGRKLVRNFNAPSGPEESIKCSMCGERQALHEPKRTGKRQVEAFWNKIAAVDYRFRRGEYLCSLCLGKRFAPDYFKDKLHTKARFPSTAEVAASPFRRRVLQYAASEYADFEQRMTSHVVGGLTGRLLPANDRLMGGATGQAVLDGHWLFIDNYVPREFPDETNPITIRSLKDNIKQLTALVNEKCPGVDGPSPYYAVLIMDADHLGQKLSRVTSIEQHAEFSRCLAEFASSVAPDIVEGGERLGRLVYAGGDDFLALVSIDHLLPIMEELRTTFACRMNEAFPAIAQNDSFTLSAGVCLSHYGAPLRTALATARTMLDLVKPPGGGNRNAFAITALSHSGNHKTACAPWMTRLEGFHLPIMPELITLSRCLMKGGGLSDRFIYTFRNEYRRCLDPDGGLVKVNRICDRWTPVKQELMRLIRRASDIEKLARTLGCTERSVAERLDGLAMRLLSLQGNFTNFTSLLEIINLISKGAMPCE